MQLVKSDFISAVLGILLIPLFHIEGSLISTLGRNMFSWDDAEHLNSIDSVLTHPYLQRGIPQNHWFHQASRDNVMEFLYPNYNNTSLGQPRKHNIAKRFIDEENMPIVEILVLFRFPVLDTGFNLEILLPYSTELLTVKDTTARHWEDTIEPSITDLEGLLSMLGVDGHSCMLRTVCELSSSPSIALDGLVGEMVKVFINYLTAEEDSTLNRVDTEEVSQVRQAYLKAALFGRHGKCDAYHEGCPLSLTNLINDVL